MSIKAVIFDMDGVVTDTAKLHFKAWKQMFDCFLAARTDLPTQAVQPFTHEDYLNYVDGLPRINGISNFLKSRSIQLPIGNKKDLATAFSVNGLAKNKNNLFIKLLAQEGAEVFTKTLELIKVLREQKIKTAVVSSSKNCETVLAKAGLTQLFDVRIDGVMLQELKLPGKPNPAMFLEAAERLHVEPKECVVVEGAICGIIAAKQGEFGFIIAVDRHEKITSKSLELGADIVVRHLGEINIQLLLRQFATHHLPKFSALADFEQIVARTKKRQIALFLDYDGTLAPIVDDPKLTKISPTLHELLLALSNKITVGIISGRQLEDVRRLINIDSLVYAGNHGFEIAGPQALNIDQNWGQEHIQHIQQAFENFKTQLGNIPGILIENKQYTLSIHYRKVKVSAIAEIEKTIEQYVAENRHLKLLGGKKIFEVRPNINWNKGEALKYFMSSLQIDQGTVMPIYIGDDVADEDAFASIHAFGVGILVADRLRLTHADFLLSNTDEVEQFIKETLLVVNLNKRVS